MTGTQRFRLGIAAVALAQGLILLGMVWQQADLLRNGREITLDVIPVDPRSLFRGDYVELSYPISRLDAGVAPKVWPKTQAMFVTLSRHGVGEAGRSAGAWRAVRVDARYVTPTSADEVVLKARPRFGWAGSTGMVRYGIESYFVPEGTGRTLEKIAGEKRLSVLVAVGKRGEAAIKGLYIDGKLVHKESLL